MARSQSNTVVKVLGAGFAVIAGGAAFGYLFGSAHLPHPPEQTASPVVSTTLTPAPKLNPSLIHPHTANGNYTAPGAPRITIEEQSQPILRRIAPPPAPAADPEASQEAAVSHLKSAPDTTPADTAPSTPADSSPSPTPETTPSGPSASTDSAPPSSPPAPSDPDFEHVNGPKQTTPKPADPEAGQQGGDKSQDGKSQTDTGGRAQFRVQTGAYTDESNARSVADTLRSQGFTTSTRSERDGSRLVYKVQVGAYRSKNGASKAADDLQRKGYSAVISPITP